MGPPFVKNSRFVLTPAPADEKTPGGSDRYVRDTATGEAYVIAGTIANDLVSADNRLIEREFHDFGEAFHDLHRGFVGGYHHDRVAQRRLRILGEQTQGNRGQG